MPGVNSGVQVGTDVMRDRETDPGSKSPARCQSMCASEDLKLELCGGNRLITTVDK